MIEGLGAKPVPRLEDYKSCSIFIPCGDGDAPWSRTAKTLAAVSVGAEFVTQQWLVDSYKAKELLPCDTYLIDKIQPAIAKALRNHPSGVLSGRHVHFLRGVAGKVAPDMNSLKLLTKFAGGVWTATQADACDLKDPSKLLIIGKEDQKLPVKLKPLVVQGAHHIDWSHLAEALETQSLDIIIGNQCSNSKSDTSKTKLTSTKPKAKPSKRSSIKSALAALSPRSKTTTSRKVLRGFGFNLPAGETPARPVSPIDTADEPHAKYEVSGYEYNCIKF